MNFRMGLASLLAAQNQGGGAPPANTQPSAPPMPGQSPGQQAGGYPSIDYNTSSFPQQQQQYGGGQSGFPTQQPSADPFNRYSQPQQQQYGGGQAGYPSQSRPQQQQQSPYGGYGQQAPQQGGFPGQQNPGQYGQQGQQQQQQQAPSGGGGLSPQQIQQKLQTIVQQNRLEAFYPPQALQSVAQRVSRVDMQSISQKYRMPMEVASSLVSLALYDTVLFCDDSGSMAFEENGERIQDLKVILQRAAEVTCLFDDDGIQVRFMNGSVEGNGIRDTVSAGNLVQQVQFNGMTPLGTSLDTKVIRPFLGTQYGAGAIAFEFAQVGKDQGAQKFLASLDNDPNIGGSIDATSYYELEAEEFKRKGVTLTPDVWLLKLLCGAIDKSLDESD
ncbi:hypothetical protein WJX73_002748 [Symbiochloris irregularis]|uniref:VWFA domain-containing protein n=1 Tax=Symbiochloris irregularis TaxID=706552 RepID=A0AAW1P076_9CHLO